MRRSRRDFLKVAATSAVAASGGVGILPATSVPGISGRVAPNDRIHLATIGMGIIGFEDSQTALKVPGV
ncbi:MAG: twin-arginine translocation signal domain-containing protein, partial [bacterium]